MVAPEEVHEEGDREKKESVGARGKALESMWRSLGKPYAKFFPPHLEDPSKEILRQAACPVLVLPAAAHVAPHGGAQARR